MINEQLKILLVDDDQIDRMAVKRALKKSGLEVKVTEVENGSEALATINDSISTQQHNIFDIILVDYLLPDGDGLNLIKKIQNFNHQIPLIVLTGQGDEEIAVEIMKAGAADYITKAKIEGKSLAKAITTAIRLQQAEKAVELANQRLRATNELLILKNQELERQQEQIKLQNIQLQEAYNLKSQFLATMSHELRTPMNAIMGFSQLLLRQYPDPLTSTQQELVQRIFNNSQNLLNMINEMLDFSKIEAGKLEINSQQFNLSNLVTLTVEELRSLTTQKQISLEININLANPNVIQDSNYLKRILINLLSNAIKFTDKGGVTVEVWEKKSQLIAIAVKDTGIGIASENLETIFQAFRQVDQSFTRKYSGTGLGLAITESLVKAIGGTIFVDSILGQGSKFQIEIPRNPHSAGLIYI
jgi:signal transduction histidine kinase